MSAVLVTRESPRAEPPMSRALREGADARGGDRASPTMCGRRGGRRTYRMCMCMQPGTCYHDTWTMTWTCRSMYE
eukprot:2058306-Prymnesium_polylepis.3